MMSEVFPEFDNKEIDGVEDKKTPFDTFLCANYKKSLAYMVIKRSMPVLLNKIIKTLDQKQEEILKTYGEQASEDVKQVVKGINKLKIELTENKPLAPLIPIKDKKNDDSAVWNEKLEKLSRDHNKIPTWFNTIFFISESYLYRRVIQEFFLTKYLQTFDPFAHQKQEIYYEKLQDINLLSEHMIVVLNKKCDDVEQEKNFSNLLKLNLWGNRSDLYLLKRNIILHNNTIDLLKSLNENILVNNCKDVWKVLYGNFQCQNKNPTIIDVVLDNAGYELFTDLCLAAFLINEKLADKIRFYVKSYPWFISDVLKDDFYWLIETMMKSDKKNIQLFGAVCNGFLKNGLWDIQEESYWTEPFDYTEMKSIRPQLYNKLSTSILVIIKGDLNYSKLLSDINWKHTTDFNTALKGFEPTNLVCLRTIKSDIFVGLTSEKVEELSKQDPNWMYTGKFGLIQAFILNENKIY